MLWRILSWMEQLRVQRWSVQPETKPPDHSMKIQNLLPGFLLQYINISLITNGYHASWIFSRKWSILQCFSQIFPIICSEITSRGVIPLSHHANAPTPYIVTLLVYLIWFCFLETWAPVAQAGSNLPCSPGWSWSPHSPTPASHRLYHSALSCNLVKANGAGALEKWLSS